MKRVRRPVKWLITACVTLACLFGVSGLLTPKNISMKTGEFYQYPDDYDVWFFGSSHTVMGISPLEIYRRTGITSYNLADYGQWIPVDYWIMRCALEKQTPKLVVIDTYGAFWDVKYSDIHFAYLHEMIDPIPLSKTKIEMIRDLFGDSYLGEFLFPFSAHHSRWAELSEKDFQKTDKGFEKGADVNAFLGTKTEDIYARFDIPEPAGPEVRMEGTNTGLEYLEKMIVYLQERNIDVLLVNTPFYCGLEQIQAMNSASEIGEKYGCKNISTQYIKGLLNGYTDLRDIGHLNSSGTVKWSDYLADFIVKNYPDIKDRRSDKELDARWQNSIGRYRAFMDQKLNEEEKLYDWLVLASDKDYDVMIRLNQDAFVYDDKYIMALIHNISDYPGLDAAMRQRAAFTGVTGHPERFSDRSLLDRSQTSADIEITVLNKESGELVAKERFRLNHDDSSLKVYDKLEKEEWQ